MISQLAYTTILGYPLILYFGILNLSLLLFTASIAVFNHLGVRYIPFKWHPRFAAITIVSVLIHGTLGMSVYLKW